MPKTIQQEIANYFFEKTNRKATPGLFRQALGNVNTLLNSGFTSDEIKMGIDYCVLHPPSKGFNSIGWLSYTLNDIIKEQQAQQIRNMQEAAQEFTDNAEASIENIKKFVDKQKAGIRIKGGKW